MRIGTTAIKMPAACPVLLLANWPWKFNSPTGMVLFASELNKIRAKRKLVPGRHRVQDEHRDQGGSGQRKDQGEEDPPRPSAIHLGCFDELVRQLPEERLQNEYLERDAEREVRTYQTRNTVNGSHAA